MSVFELLLKGDAVSSLVALALLAMSVASWVVILWKGWLLQRARSDVVRSTAAFWQASDLTQALQIMQGFDREGMVCPLVRATQTGGVGTLASAGAPSMQVTRALRDALQAVLRRLQAGQVLLATVGSIAPFVGLLGTVWGIYHALIGIAAGAQISIDRISGPVGESLTMTAAGLSVAIPAVLGYNILGRVIARIEVDLEGFAGDLRELLCGVPAD
jgi:biopolymer transport protein ExbB